MKIQAYLTAAAINLKRLAAAVQESLGAWIAQATIADARHCGACGKDRSHRLVINRPGLSANHVIIIQDKMLP